LNPKKKGKMPWGDSKIGGPRAEDSSAEERGGTNWRVLHRKDAECFERKRGGVQVSGQTGKTEKKKRGSNAGGGALARYARGLGAKREKDESSHKKEQKQKTGGGRRKKNIILSWARQ